MLAKLICNMLLPRLPGKLIKILTKIIFTVLCYWLHGTVIHIININWNKFTVYIVFAWGKNAKIDINGNKCCPWCCLIFARMYFLLHRFSHKIREFIHSDYPFCAFLGRFWAPHFTCKMELFPMKKAILAPFGLFLSLLYA